MLYNNIISESSIFFHVLCDHVTVPVTVVTSHYNPNSKSKIRK